jgi:hypothetical protein
MARLRGVEPVEDPGTYEPVGGQHWRAHRFDGDPDPRCRLCIRAVDTAARITGTRPRPGPPDAA